jgi:hypothetical protein
MTLEELYYSEISSNIRRAILDRNFDVTIGRVACEASSATWNLGTNSAFAVGPRKTTENLDHVGQLQDLSDVDCLLAGSPALNTRTLTLVPIWLLFYLKKEVYIFVFTDLPFYMHTLDEHQTFMYNICKENACLHAHTCRQIYIYLYL